MENEVTVVNNPNMTALVSMMDRLIETVQTHWTSDLNEWDDFQRARVVDQVEAIKALKDFFVDTQKKIDIIKTANREYEVETHPAVVDLENEVTNVFVNMVVTWRDELLQSPSNRRPYGLEEHDSGRFDQSYVRIMGFITDYIDVRLPIDYAGSSPREAEAPDPRTGVNP